MKIVLVKPRFASRYMVTPPLGLGYLSSSLEAAGARTVILDAHREGLPALRAAERVLAERPDAVGITCTTADHREVAGICRALAGRVPRLVLGGPHPTFLPRETLADTGADMVVRGEGEMAFTALARAGFDPAGIPGVVCAGAPPGPCEGAAEAAPDLDLLPFPDWGKMDPRAYPLAPHGVVAMNHPIGVLVTSRGCPFDCSFCSVPGFHGRSIRFRSASNVVDEIQLLVERFGVREVHFADDNFTFGRSHVESVCREILDRRVRVSWSCPNGVRADLVDEELLRLMKASGCYYLAFGIESADPGILDRAGKRERVEDFERAISAARRAGIDTQGFFVLGLPGETRESMERTMEWARRSGLDRAQFAVLDVLPGSRLWRELSGTFSPDWGKNSLKEPEWIPEGLSAEELRRAQSRAFRRFYLGNPRAVWSLLKHLKPRQVPFLLQRVIDYRFLSPRS